jgi:transcriptional regulator with XRE-family HTH domain
MKGTQKENGIIEIFSKNLAEARKAAGYKTARAFADAFPEIPYSTYCGYENKYVWPSPENLIIIADALNVSIDALLGRKPAASEEEAQIQRMIMTLKIKEFFVTDIPEEKKVEICLPVLFRTTSKATGKRVTKKQKEAALEFYSQKFLIDQSKIKIPYSEAVEAVAKAEEKTREAMEANDRFLKNKENQKRCFQAFFCAYITKPRMELFYEILRQSPDGKFRSEENKDFVYAISQWGEFINNMINIHKVPIPKSYDDFE